jgi:prepilin-type N-terminal cleavage/methylation domain-containing protein
MRTHDCETAKRRNGETAKGRRPGFTLVEMIVVLTIMLILTVIAVAVAPRFQENDNVVKAADRISQWLVIAREWAKRDQVPTGVRLQNVTSIATISTTSVPPPPPNPGYIQATITPTAMGGMTATGIPWNIMPYSILVVDPGMPSSEIVSVLAVSGTTFTAVFRNPHTAPFVIRVLAYSQELQYIQQPDDLVVTPGNNWQPGSTTTPYPVRRLSPGVWVPGATGGYVWDGTHALLETPIPPPISPIPPPWSDFSGGFISGSNPQLLWPVQPGDYLEANGTGVVHYIIGVTPAPPPYLPTDYNLLQLASSFPPQLGTYSGPPLPIAPGPLTSQYRIIRAPRVLQGETPLELSTKVVVDINPKALGYDPPLPIDPLTGNIDIMFSPSGGVTGRKLGLTDKIMLWVRDGTKDPAAPGQMYLVTIQVRTGFIAVHPVQWPITLQNPDPYLYARDNRSSGL